MLWIARKDDILSIYTKEVEGIKEAGLFKGEAPFISPQGSRVKMEDGRELLCMCANNYLGLVESLFVILNVEMMCDNLGNIKSCLKHGGHLIPGIPYLSSVDSADVENL